MKKTYWRYLNEKLGWAKWIFVIVIVVMIAFYFYGFRYKNLDSWIEAKYLMAIIGVPVLLTLAIHFFQWRHDR